MPWDAAFSQELPAITPPVRGSLSLPHTNRVGSQKKWRGPPGWGWKTPGRFSGCVHVWLCVSSLCIYVQNPKSGGGLFKLPDGELAFWKPRAACGSFLAKGGTAAGLKVKVHIASEMPPWDVRRTLFFPPRAHVKRLKGGSVALTSIQKSCSSILTKLHQRTFSVSLRSNQLPFKLQSNNTHTKLRMKLPGWCWKRCPDVAWAFSWFWVSGNAPVTLQIQTSQLC